MLAVELEVLAKKFDRFGWERDRGSMAHDRQITDWMDALQDYTLDEVKAACRAAVERNPSRMPNEGHIKAEVLKARARATARQAHPAPTPEREDGITQADRRRIIRDICGDDVPASLRAFLKPVGGAE